MVTRPSQARSDEPSSHGFARFTLTGFHGGVLHNTMIFIALSLDDILPRFAVCPVRFVLDAPDSGLIDSTEWDGL